GLEEQAVPLESEEGLADGHEREVERPERDEAVARRDLKNQPEAQDAAGERRGAHRRVAAPVPEDRRRVGSGGAVRDRVEVPLRREEPARAPEQRDLDDERRERDEEHEAEDAQEQAADPGPRPRSERHSAVLRRLVDVAGAAVAGRAADPEPVARDDSVPP